MTPKLITNRLTLRGIKANDVFGYIEIRSDKETMELLHGPILTNDSEYKDFVQRMKAEREKGKSYFWTITLQEVNEFIGFIRLMSYKSEYYDHAFSSIGNHRFDDEFLRYFDRENGWELDYALLKNYRNQGIMKEAVNQLLKFCEDESIYPIYGRLNHLSNIASLKVLKHYNFKEHLPLTDLELLKESNIEEMVEKGRIGMIYKWEP